MSIDKNDVERFFSKYQSVFGEAINGHIDLNAIKSFYSEQFIAATPYGVRTAEFDGSFEEVMTKGYERYRKIGTRSMTVDNIEIHHIDDCHLIARVCWKSVYQRPEVDEIHIPFDVNYFLEQIDGKLRVFGWVTGDEEALLKANGVI